MAGAIPIFAQRLVATSLLLVTSFLFTACQDLIEGAPIYGEFAWSAYDDRAYTPLEQISLTTTEYRVRREGLIFYDYEMIDWIYQIHGGRYSRSEFIVALYENNNTPQPVELTLRPVKLVRQGRNVYIQQSFDSLPPGNYLLRIAHKSVVVDEVGFQIVPPEGPGVVRLDGSIDREREWEWEDEELDEATRLRRERERDEILRYSS